jgi:hypothetical protein
LAASRPDLDPSEPPPSTGGGRIDPNLTFVLNLLGAASAGYFLLGQKKKGIAALVLFAVLFAPPSCGTASMLVALVTAIDGYRQARKLQSDASGR